MFNKIEDVPSGVSITVHSNFLKCTKCGALFVDSTYNAIATDEYGELASGQVARRFNLDGPNPFCGCVDHVWLTSGGLGFAVKDWPVSVHVELNVR